MLVLIYLVYSFLLHQHCQCWCNKNEYTTYMNTYMYPTKNLDNFIQMLMVTLRLTLFCPRPSPPPKIEKKILSYIICSQ